MCSPVKKTLVTDMLLVIFYLVSNIVDLIRDAFEKTFIFVSISKKVGGGQDKISILGPAKIVTFFCRRVRPSPKSNIKGKGEFGLWAISKNCWAATTQRTPYIPLI